MWVLEILQIPSTGIDLVLGRRKEGRVAESVCRRGREEIGRTWREQVALSFTDPPEMGGDAAQGSC